MKIHTQKLDVVFICLIVTVVIRQICFKESNASFASAVCSFTFDHFDLHVSLGILFSVGFVVPFVLLYAVFMDIHRRVYPLANFIKEVIVHHLFFCFITGCVLYSLDLIEDYTSPLVGSDRFSAWHKYIFHFVLTPMLFVDSVYNIEIQKMVQKGEHLSTFKSRMYYVSQGTVIAYLTYCFCVLMYLEGQLAELIHAALEMRSPVLPEGFSLYLQNLSKNAIGCIFLTLFFGLLDQGVVADNLPLLRRKRQTVDLVENIRVSGKS